jgi:hypothetical protein
MKKKLCLILSLALLALQVLPVASAFAALPPYEPAEGDHFDPKDYYLNYESQGINLLQRPRITLSVNDEKSNDRIASDQTLAFTATVRRDSRIQTPPSTVTFSYGINGTLYENTISLVNGVATYTLSYNDLTSAGAVPNTNYTMTATYGEDGITEVTDQVRFGILGGTNPAVIFTEPGAGDTVSPNDAVALKIKTFQGATPGSLTIRWTCERTNQISSGYTCPADGAEQASLAYRAAGTYNLTVTITDTEGHTGTDTIAIQVVDDPPYVSAFTIPDEFEPGTTATAYVVASDKFGTINRLEWGCSDDGNIVFDQTFDVDPPAASIRHEITTQLPNVESDTHHCMFRAIDDDNQVSASYDLVFRTRNHSQSVVSDEPVTPTEPNTGVFTGKSASATATDVTLASLGALALCSLFAVMAKRRF